MSRPKGALNKKTRRALFEMANSAKEYEDHGKAALNYLARIMLDTQKDDAIRMRAADILLPFVAPKLSAVEQTTVIEPAALKSKAELEADYREMAQSIFGDNPELLEAALKRFDMVPAGEDINGGDPA